MSFEQRVFYAVLSTSSSNNLRTTLRSIIKKPEDGNNNLIAILNDLLKSKEKRLVGLELLQFVLVHCTADMFTQNLSQWLHFCHIRGTDTLRKAKLKALKYIFIRLQEVNSLHKTCSPELLNNTLKACLSVEMMDENVEGLSCLIQGLLTFSNWFGGHKDQIEDYLIRCLECRNEFIVELAGTAFVCLLQTGSEGVDGANYIMNFQTNFEKLYFTIQGLFNILLGALTDGDESVQITQETFGYTTVINKSDRNRLVEITTRQILSYLHLMQTMIVKRFPREKRIKLKQVIDIIYRGLSVHVCFSFANDLNHQLLKKIQLRLLVILRVVLKSFQTLLLPFAVYIEKCLVNLLEGACSCSCLELDDSYKISVYQTLTIWLSFGNVRDENWLQKKLLPILIKDLFTLRNKFVETGDGGSPLYKNVESLVPCHALKVLQKLFAASVRMDGPLFKELLHCILNIFNEVSTGKAAPLYKTKFWQEQMADLLLTIYEVDNVECFPSLHWVMSMCGRMPQISDKNSMLLERLSHCMCCSPQDHTQFQQIPQKRVFESPREENGFEKELEERKVTVIENIVINSTADVEMIDECCTQNASDDDAEKKSSKLIEVDLSIEEDYVDDICILDDASPIYESRQNLDETPIKSAGSNGVDEFITAFQDVIE